MNAVADAQPVDAREGDFAEVAEGVIVRPMLTIDDAIDLFVGELARRGYSNRTRDTYRRILDKLCDTFPGRWDVAQVRADDCRRFLDTYNRHAAGTRAHAYSVLSSFFFWLEHDEKIKRSPLATIGRPKRLRAEDLDVVSVTPDGIRALLAAADTWTEKLAVAIPAYIGPRRRAVASLRLSDYDRDRRQLRFREKGSKTIWKPAPDELVVLLEAALAAGAIEEPDGYLVPPEGYLTRKGDRDDRVIWRVVKRVADRAGIEATVHALRAAFAVFYLEGKPGDVEALKELLGHRSLQTTQTYLRKLDRGAAMERVRDLSYVTHERPQDDEVLDDSVVYFIAAGDIAADGTPVKIGYSRDVTARLQHLQDAHHEDLHLVSVFPGGIWLERELHEACAPDRLRGEWFRSSPRLRTMLAVLETRMNAGVAAKRGFEAGVEVGAGGFEPPSSDSTAAEGGDTQLRRERLDEALKNRIAEGAETPGLSPAEGPV